jgi:hypothetical protein
MRALVDAWEKDVDAEAEALKNGSGKR